MTAGQQQMRRLTLPHRGQAPLPPLIALPGLDHTAHCRTVRGMPVQTASPVLTAKTRSNCGRGLAPDGGGTATHVSTDTPTSGASPLPPLIALPGLDHTAHCRTVRGMPIQTASQALTEKTGSNCGRGLAPDGGGSATHVSTDTPTSGASPLPPLIALPGPGHTAHCRTVRGMPVQTASQVLTEKTGSNCGRGLAPDGGGTATHVSTDTPTSGASPLPP